ncbi:MAG TPA: substrate-binding domain-containing protein [Verrucomicrobiae bacterium]|jgi:DNA-binding LacI/PurR family transcriptional regulator|nr:substrate-binding domain-containing protein [Verrucomicrobiae bacterium]
MKNRPERTSLVRKTAIALMKEIEDGSLAGNLPGELQLKEQLAIGRDTLRLALKLLEKDGWLTAPRQGRRRAVIPHRVASHKTSEQLPVTFLSPYAVVDRIVLLELEDLQLQLSEQGRSLRFLSSRLFHLANPEHQLEQLVHEHPSAAWILYMNSEAMQRWFEKKGIPTFIYGSPFADVKLPYVVNDWEAAAFHAGIQLGRNGHRVVALFRSEQNYPGMIMCEKGLRRALASLEPKGRLLLFYDDQTPQSVARSLDNAFASKQQPKALVFTSSSQVLTCLSWLVSRGIRSPNDVSLVSLPSDSWFVELHPPLCHYQCNSRVFARHLAVRVMELIESGRVSRKSVRVRLEYVPGATIGAAL